MPHEHSCGPEHHKEFFDAIVAILRKFPNEAKQYAIKCIDHETDIMRVDFDAQIGVSRIEGDRVITEFRDKEKLETASYGFPAGCCQWKMDPITQQPVCVTKWS